jgi:hypothetical protein
MSNIRNAALERLLPDSDYEKLFKQHPEYRIYTIVSNSPQITYADKKRIETGWKKQSWIEDRQRIRNEDGSWYIDEFGLYVYIQSYIGAFRDQDLRYEKMQDRITDLFILTHVI